jgi:hypothetical protein
MAQQMKPGLFLTGWQLARLFLWIFAVGAVLGWVIWRNIW